MSIFNALLAAAGTTPEGPDQMTTIIQSILLFGGIFVVFYLVIIRPERKKRKESLKMREELKVGDEIVTAGGIVGKISAIKDETVTIETGAGTEKSRVKLQKWAIASRTPKED